MESYCDPKTGLPQPSYDLWEERRGVLAFTTATVWAGLTAAARFATAFGETACAEEYSAAAARMKQSVGAVLYRPELKRFVRMANQRSDGSWAFDEKLDASLFGLWYFGMFPPDDPRITETMTALQEGLRVKTSVGGIARYENDYYHQQSQDLANVPGNPWFICTLWMAQYFIARAQTEEELREALPALQWCVDHALPSGVLAEQGDPYTHAPIALSPRNSSHTA